MKALFRDKYFYRVLLLITIALLLTINLLSFILYKNYEVNTINKFREINIEILNETSRMNEFIGRNVKLSGMNLFHETPIQRLMNNSVTSNFEKVEAIRRMDTIKSTGLHYHSIYIYNPEMDYIYATSNYLSSSKDRFFDEGIIDLVESDKNLKSFYPIPRWIEDGNYKHAVCTYFFYEGSNLSTSNGILVINLDLNWLNEIEGVNDKNTSLYIIDQDRRVVYNSDREKFLMDLSDYEYIDKIFSSEEVSGSFIEKLDNGKTLVMYSKPEGQEWYFIKLMPYESLVDNIVIMRMNTIKYTSIFLVIGLGISFMLSKRLSSPIDRIMEMIKDFGGQKDSDDISYITTSIQDIIVKTSDLENISKSYLNELKKELMREIIIGNIKGEKNILTTLKDYNMELPYYGDYHLLLCYKGSGYTSESNQLDFDECIYHLNMGTDSIHIIQDANSQRLNQVIDMFRFQGIQLIVCSRQVKSLGEFKEEYDCLNELLKNRVFYPKGYVIYSINEEKKFGYSEYPLNKESEIISSLRKGNIEESKISFNEFIESINVYRYDYFKFNLVRLFFAIKNLISDIEINEYLTGYHKLNRDCLEKYLEEINHISELDIYFEDIFTEIISAVEKGRSKRNLAIIKKVIEYVEENYQDVNLSTQSISDFIGLSSSYVNQIFKSEKDISISEYILNFRMEKAKFYLMNKDITIKDIANKVGFHNDNYFYTVFKKITYLTPGQYRKQHS